MKHCLVWLVSLALFCVQSAFAKENALGDIYLGSREGDPASLVENVSTIHGDYTEVEVDLTVPAPDTLILSRFYSSRDTLQTATLGGWRFNPHCFLSIQKDPEEKQDTTGEGTFGRTYVYVGNPDGALLTYVGWTNPTKRTLFKIDAEREGVGLANTAKGMISCWTNLKNNKLYFNPKEESFELHLSSEGKRFYVKHPSRDFYIITHEILPSGNQIFYEFDDQGQLILIKETNASEKKVLAWIKIHYGEGVQFETSDGKTADYQFQQDPSGAYLLTSVTRSDKPPLHYHYQVIDERALLLRKELPEGRFIQVDYDDQHKVKAVTTPISSSEVTTTQFSYGERCTQVDGPGECKALYRFDERLQLIAIEHYLEGSLYRIHKKSWGIKSDVGNLIATSVEDAEGNLFHYKHFTYDTKRGNLVEEHEYGDIAGTGAIPLIIDKKGVVTNQDGHVKKYAYFSGDTTYGVFQGDMNGTGVKSWYKKGTHLLLKKFLLTNASLDSEDENSESGIEQRHFYEYNEDAVLVRVVVDDGREVDPKDTYRVTERLITTISPKQELPNVGAPEVIEQRYSDPDGKAEFLLKRTVNHFGAKGDVVSQAIYDAHEEHRYSVTRAYDRGLLIFETDPLGNETHYSYDANQNLVSESHSATGISTEYGYDLRNRPICTVERDGAGNHFKTHISYDAAGYRRAEVDRFGNETLYINDAFGRPLSITYPEVSDGLHSSIKPTYTYAYDLFDHPTSVTDPKGRALTRRYNVKGQPAEINYLDGTKEIFRYDSGGNLHHYYGRDGLLQVFKCDHIGRLNHVAYYKQESNSSGYPFKETTYYYRAFHKIFETDERGRRTAYTYDRAGRLATLQKGDRKIELIYDALGRMQRIKTWKSSDIFALETKEYDLLDRVIEERSENSKGHTLIKKRYVYNKAGQLAQLIGYPHNQESILMRYEYDGFGRLCKATNAANYATQLLYDDNYVNEWGQKGRKRTSIDPIGNRTEEIFDNDDNLIKVAKKDRSGELLSCVESSYDGSGNQILERAVVIAARDLLRTYETAWSVNQAGQLESITLGKGTPEEHTTRFEYSSYGDLAAKYNPGFQEPITYQYNDQGNLNTLSYKDGTQEIRYKPFYDRNSTLTSLTRDSSFTLTYTFDDHDLPLIEKIKDEYGVYEIGRIYNGEGKIQTIELPDGSSIEYAYDGPFVKSATRFSKGGRKRYHYQVVLRDQMGNILEEILPGPVGTRNQQWDEGGRRVAIVTNVFQDKVLEGGYDALDNIEKRETRFHEHTYTTDYAYNALAQLTHEKGEIEHKYFYDSIDNRLQKDGSVYKVNVLNQLIEAEGISYTFDPRGHLATKTVGGRIWTYQSNPLNQIVSIKDPDQNTLTFTYDPIIGKRLSRCIKSKGKKTRVSRFFYLGNTEIGSVNENGVITELKVPSDPNNPEAPCIAIEIKKEIYIPLHDLQGNVVCLCHYTRGAVVETYRYSVYGEETIIDENEKVIASSSIGNPWRYRGKRVDEEVGLIYFGYRYYDPAVGRWISPDPAGAMDGPNLYAYTRNNPMTYMDYFGLSSIIDANCGCIYHDHPGWYSAPSGCVCICGRDNSGETPENYRSRRGSDLTSAFGGIGYAVVEFAMGSIHNLHTAAVYIGSGELEMSLHERVQMVEAVEHSQSRQMDALETTVRGILSIDPSDEVYQSFRSTTTMGLNIASLIAGGYGTVKSVIAFNRLARVPVQTAKLVKQLGRGEGFFGHKGFELKNPKYQTLRNKPITIQNRAYSGHALDQMQNRGFIPSVVEETIKSGIGTPNKIFGRMQFYDPANNISVITEGNEVITIMYGRVN